jgi:uncharacterized protein YecE (DUF72 family)
MLHSVSSSTRTGFSLTGSATPSAQATNAAPLRCGVAGWDHGDWDHCLYPHPRSRSFHPLRYLASRVDCLEADSTFLRIPRPETTALWAAHTSANPDLRFTVRLHRDFTHERRLEPTQLAAFFEAMSPLQRARKLGCVVMQMPASFRFNTENRDYLIRLRRAFHKFPLVAELRHRTWAADEALGTLVDYHIGFANLDQPEASCAMPPSSKLTTGIGYFKFHGRSPIPGHFDFDATTAKQAAPYLYTLADLEASRQRIEYVRRFASEVYVSFANSAAACSMTNALQMESMLDVARPQPRKWTSAKPAARPEAWLPFRAA